MKPPKLDADKFIEKRRTVNTVGGLRREKMIVMKLGERRGAGYNQPEQPDRKTTK